MTASIVFENSAVYSFDFEIAIEGDSWNADYAGADDLTDVQVSNGYDDDVAGSDAVVPLYCCMVKLVIRLCHATLNLKLCRSRCSLLATPNQKDASV